MSWLPSDISVLPSFSRLPPAAGGDLAFKLFCTPSLSERKAPNHAELVARARYHLREAKWQKLSTAAGVLQTYVFNPSRPKRGTVLIVHGWTSEASFMSALAEQVRRAGFRAVLFDLPAHGLSAGRTTDLLACARATLEIGKSFGPLQAVLAHSFGCVAALLAMEGRSPIREKLEPEKIVLIASPNKLWDVTSAFADRWQVPIAARRRLQKRLERVGERPMSEFTSAKLLKAVARRALVVHSRDDQDFAFQCAEEIVAEAPDAVLKSFDGFGHRNLLFAPPVIRSIVAFLNEAKNATGAKPAASCADDQSAPRSIRMSRAG